MFSFHERNYTFFMTEQKFRNKSPLSLEIKKTQDKKESCLRDQSHQQIDSSGCLGLIDKFL